MLISLLGILHDNIFWIWTKISYNYAEHFHKFF